MKLLYVNIAGGILAVLLAGALAYVDFGNARIRTEAGQFLQVVESLQSKLLAARQTLQSQQEKLNKGSAISDSVGPAVVADISAFAEKSNNARLRELLQRHTAKVASVQGEGGEEKGGN